MNETSPNYPGQPPFRRRTQRHVLIGLATVITLTALFYLAEDWRGNRAWASFKTAVGAKGEVFDWSTRIPPPVPDSQNFFKAPKMAEWFAGRGDTDLSKRLADPKTASVGSTNNAIQTAADARDYLAWSDQFQPDFDLIRAALKRPYARIDCDYSRPMTVLAPNFLTIRNVAQTLAQRARCDFLLGRPDDALQELTLIHNLCRMLKGAPTGKPMTLVAAMIDVAVAGLYADTIADGLGRHAWGEPQLAALERQLAEVDLGPSLAETFIDEPMFSLQTIETSSRAELVKLCQDAANESATKKAQFSLKYGPHGWLYQNMVIHAQLVRRFADGFDAANQTISPRQVDDAGRELQNVIKHVSPYNFLTSCFTPNYVKALQRFAWNQTSVNEAAVACALERYRLAHGAYPESLDALVPQSIEALPHDVIGGQPLHYHRTASDKFLLYSIGWNGTDDGGVPGTDSDMIKGDWVWKQ